MIASDRAIAAESAMDPQELQAKRWQVGAIALLLLTGCAVLAYVDSSRQAVIAVMLRIGIVMGCLWLAIPTMVRHPRILRRLPWYVLLTGILLVAFIKNFLFIIPLFIALAILVMFTGRKPPQ